MKGILRRVVYFFMALCLGLAFVPDFRGSAEEGSDDYFVWPLDDGATNIGSAFGFRRSAGRTHLGIDVMIPVGSPVYAATSGTVRVAAYEGSWGNHIVIDHDAPFENLTTHYAHLSTIGENIRPGTHVERGQQIAASGRSGNATAAHLHFEIETYGSKVNPLPMIHRDETRSAGNPNPLYIYSGGRWVFYQDFDPTFTEHEYNKLTQGSNSFLLPSLDGDYVAPFQDTQANDDVQVTQAMVPAVSEGLGASSWAAPEVDVAISLGLIPQNLLTDFQSDITRREFCETIVQSLLIISGMDEKPDELVREFELMGQGNPFGDTSDKFVIIAFNWGIVTGVGYRTFAPNKTIKRQEASAMLSRAADTFEITGYEDFSVDFSDADSLTTRCMTARGIKPSRPRWPRRPSCRGLTF